MASASGWILGLVLVGAAASWGGPAAAQSESHWKEARARMVEEQIRARGISDERVLAALGEVPRHRFIPESVREQAYEDHPLPIGEGQTISQPYIVALMTQLAELPPSARVLEIGTGSGYQAAVLSRIAGEVYSIEILGSLSERAGATLQDLGYRNVHLRVGDGYAGWPDAGPFDAILVTAAAPERIPPPLEEQLKVGGRLIIPLGDYFQDLVVLTRTPTGKVQRSVIPVRFVPMVGAAQGDGGAAP